MTPEKNPALDILIPSKDRHEKIYELLKTLSHHDLSDIRVLVVDDCSEDLPADHPFPYKSYEPLIKSFNNPAFQYARNEKNIGLAATWMRYYEGAYGPVGAYVINPTDKDEFIAAEPLLEAIRWLDSHPDYNMAMFATTVFSRHEDNVLLPNEYNDMDGPEFLNTYFKDANLQRSSPYAMKRNAYVAKMGGLRNLNMESQGLRDAFGIDMELFLRVAHYGKVKMFRKPYIRIVTHAGATERYPLSFAYCYYQYIRRILKEFLEQGQVKEESIREFIKFWHLLMMRGFQNTLNPVHGTEAEIGRSLIGNRLKYPLHLYLLKEKYLWKVGFCTEEKQLFRKTLPSMFR
jgi:glycosyltransferase involved in cell wall biosynthesis